MITKEEFIRSFHLFEHFSEPAVSYLADILGDKLVVNGNMVFSEGDHDGMVYFLISGDVSVLKSSIAGEIYSIADTRKKENLIFGEGAILSPDPKSAGLKTMSECQFYTLKNTDFELFSDRFPKDALKTVLKIANEIKNRLQQSNKDLVKLHTALIKEIES